VNGLNYNAAKRPDQCCQARADASDAEIRVRLTFPMRLLVEVFRSSDAGYFWPSHRTPSAVEA
jgi:hypothetical protein